MVRPPLLAKAFFRGVTWRVKNTKKEVFITFDDGPVPEVTPWVLDEADKWNVKLTFFCIGDNVRKHPDVYDEVVRRGHRVGNHTFNHLNAWKVGTKEYFRNIDKAEKMIESDLFRPPYGKLYPWYVNRLKGKFGKIVMWDILSKDYDRNISGEQVFGNVKENLREGSIIVFHDSLKAEKNMKYAFPKTLELIAQKGYKTQVIK